MIKNRDLAPITASSKANVSENKCVNKLDSPIKNCMDVGNGVGPLELERSNNQILTVHKPLIIIYTQLLKTNRDKCRI